VILESPASEYARQATTKKYVLEFISTLIHSIIYSSEVLRSVKVEVNADKRDILFSNFLSKSLLKKQGPSLPVDITTDLTTFQMQVTPQACIEYVERVLRFIGAQTELRNLKVPVLSNDPDAAKREKLLLASVLPEAAHTVYFSSDNALYPDIFDALPSLKSLTVHCANGIARLASALNEKTYPELRFLTLVEKPGEIGPIILEAFPNLTKLKLKVGKGTVTDQLFQLIIHNLPQLQSLDLSSCDFVSDFGVTGITKERCTQLWDSRSFYVKGNGLRFRNDRTGLPLSSLKCE
jgi:hypothetical protein